MLSILGLALVGWLPQAPAAPIVTTPLGWPATVGSVGGEPAPQPVGKSTETRDPGAEPGGFAPLDPEASAVPSPLLPVFRAVGTAADAKALGGVTCSMRILLYDHRGAVLGEREAMHEADLSAPARDRLLLPREQVYGRDGVAVFAQYRGLAFPGLEAEARDELSWFGLVLRVPWVFADPTAFTVRPREELLWNGRPMSRYRIAARASGQDDANADRFELWCEPDTSEPRLLVLQPADPAARPCRVRLLDFKAIGNVRMPMRRLIEGSDGGRRLEMELRELRPAQAFPARHFAPPPR